MMRIVVRITLTQMIKTALAEDTDLEAPTISREGMQGSRAEAIGRVENIAGVVVEVDTANSLRGQRLRTFNIFKRVESKRQTICTQGQKKDFKGGRNNQDIEGVAIEEEDETANNGKKLMCGK
jgi:hypothetical protein